MIRGVTVFVYGGFFDLPTLLISRCHTSRRTLAFPGGMTRAGKLTSHGNGNRNRPTSSSDSKEREHLEKNSQRIIQRLTALWALNEAFLGGILHGFHIPQTGVIVGGIAVLCISAIAWHRESPGDIIKATFVVMLIKGILSPHTPLNAYAAVLFQGAMGELLFFHKRFFRVAAFIFAVVALMQSALQKIITLTLVFGFGLWEALDEFMGIMLQRFAIPDGHFGLYLVIAYLVEHLSVGIALGLIAGRIPHVGQAYLERHQNLLFPLSDDVGNGGIRRPKGKKRRFHGFFLAFGIFLLCLLLFSYWHGEQGFMSQHKVLVLIVRSVLVLSVWYCLLAPILTRLFQKWLQRKRTRLSEEMEHILEMLPQTQHIIEQSWRRSNARAGWSRLRFFFLISLVNLFAVRHDFSSK